MKLDGLCAISDIISTTYAPVPSRNFSRVSSPFATLSPFQRQEERETNQVDVCFFFNYIHRCQKSKEFFSLINTASV